MDKAYCEVCGKEIERKRRFIFERKTCSSKCRQIKWALSEANKVFKKKVIVILFLLSASNLYAYSNDQVCDAIYRAENSVKYPYGIKSVKCVGESECRKVCLNTVKNNRVRYADYGHKKYDDYLSFLASRYAPVSDSPLNKNWLKNVTFFLKKG